MTDYLAAFDTAHPSELELLIQAHCEGTSTEQQATDLDRALLDSPLAVEMLCDAVRQDVLLAELFQAAEADESLDSTASGWLQAMQPIGDPGASGVRLPGRIIVAGWRKTHDLVNTFAGVSLLLSGIFITCLLLVLALITVSDLVDVERESMQPTTSEPKIVARISASKDARWSESSLTTLDGDVFLFERELLELEEGLIEVLYDSGVILVIEAPARFEVTSSTTAALGEGKLTARVPRQATGFAVSGPGVRVVDLGTEFGLHINSEGGGDVRVFQGRVRADLQPGSNAQQQHVLTAGQSLAWSSNGLPKSSSDFAETVFVRQLPRVSPLYLPDTGSQPNAGLLSVGETDSHWRVGLAGEENARQPAKVVSHGTYSLSSTASSTWISVPAGWMQVPGNQVFTFEVDFFVDDGFELDTIRAAARFAADNQVVAVRLNGHALDLPPLTEESFREEATLRLAHFFQQGRNELQVDVYNEGKNGGPMALRWEWTGRGLHTVDLDEELNN